MTTTTVARPNRRVTLFGIGAMLASVSGGACAQTSAPVVRRFGAVRVDAAPLANKGAAAAAALIQRIMPGKLASVYADLIVADRNAPVLVAEISTLYLSGYGDTPSPGLAFSTLDSMDGTGLVLAGRQLQASTPLHVTLPAGYSGAYYLPDIDDRRIDSLCYQFAYWLRREMQV